MRRAALAAAWAVVAAATGCNEQFRFDPPRDAGVDAGLDSGVDAGLDAGLDAGDAATARDCRTDGCGLSLLCDALSHECYECLDASDCGSPGDGLMWTCRFSLCVQTCNTIEDCPEEAVHCEHGICELCEDFDCPCRSADDCGGGTPWCDRRTGECVRCLYSSDCPLERPWCDPDAMACVADG